MYYVSILIIYDMIDKRIALLLIYFILILKLLRMVEKYFLIDTILGYDILLIPFNYWRVRLNSSNSKSNLYTGTDRGYFEYSYLIFTSSSGK